MQNLQEVLEKIERNGAWLNDNYKEICEKYLNEFIAVEDGVIVAHNPDFLSLLEELKSKKVDLNEVLVEFIHGKDYEIIM